jgi:hypothetical protein
MRLHPIAPALALCILPALGIQARAASAARAAHVLAPDPLGVAPFELHDAHVYVRVQAGDSAARWFILDTGASTTLDSAFAASLGRPAARTEGGGGGGESRVTVRFVDGVRLSLVDAADHAVAAVPAQRVAAVDLSAVSRAEGRPVAGILGGSFFARYAVVIDYERRRVEVHRPGSFRGPDGWAAIPLQVEGDLVFARATATLRPGEGPVAGWYQLDTGGGHALILNTPFVAGHQLAAPAAATADTLLSIGGGAAAQRGHVAAFRLGGATLTDVGALFSLARSGLYASGDFDGSVGGGLLTRFSALAFDYAAKRMWLGPLRETRD